MKLSITSTRLAIDYDTVLDRIDAAVQRALNAGDTRRREAIYDEARADNLARARAELAIARADVVLAFIKGA